MNQLIDVIVYRASDPYFEEQRRFANLGVAIVSLTDEYRPRIHGIDVKQPRHLTGLDYILTINDLEEDFHDI